MAGNEMVANGKKAVGRRLESLCRPREISEIGGGWAEIIYMGIIGISVAWYSRGTHVGIQIDFLRSEVNSA